MKYGVHPRRFPPPTHHSCHLLRPLRGLAFPFALNVTNIYIYHCHRLLLALLCLHLFPSTVIRSHQASCAVINIHLSPAPSGVPINLLFIHSLIFSLVPSFITLIPLTYHSYPVLSTPDPSWLYPVAPPHLFISTPPLSPLIHHFTR